MVIYDNIKEVADKKGLAIYEVEQRAGLANGVIGKWRTGYPRVDNLISVANALGVSVTRLLRERREDGAEEERPS